MNAILCFRRGVVAVALALAASGCDAQGFTVKEAPATPTQGVDLVTRLQSADAGEREDAADDLGDDGGPPVAAVPHLLAAISRETNPKVYKKLLRTLGKSGLMEARPYIDGAVISPDEDLRKEAKEALHSWVVRNFIWPEDEKLPDPPHPIYGPPPPLPPQAPGSRPLQAYLGTPAPPPPPVAPPPPESDAGSPPTSSSAPPPGFLPGPPPPPPR